MFLLNKFQQLIFFFGFEFDAIINIGPIITGDKLSGVFQFQFGNNFFPGNRVGGGGEGKPGDMGKAFR